MAGVGIDLLEIERLERALARRPRLADRLFTDGERAYAATRARPAMHLAARFCAKEAVAKALQLREWSWRDVEVVGGGDEPPSVRAGGRGGRACGRAGGDGDACRSPTRTGWRRPWRCSDEPPALDGAAA